MKNSYCRIKLEIENKVLKDTHLFDLFKEDKLRFRKFSVEFEDILFDFSKNLINEEVYSTLIELAIESGLSDMIKLMFSGARINKTENRAVLHTALRNKKPIPIVIDGLNLKDEIEQVNSNLKILVDSVRSGKWKGINGEQITDIVNIGIGGSDLGPAMICKALEDYSDGKINAHFVSNVDFTRLNNTFKKINPATTLFIIASKTFTTQETMRNAKSAVELFKKSLKLKKVDLSKNFIAISTNIEACKEFGIPESNIFGFWDWVGGRFSLWSAIGVSVALYLGWDKFEELKEGAYQIDKHFKDTSYEKNIPVLMALISIWNINFNKHCSQAIIPYSEALSLFPSYLQQLEMESNGKNIDCNGEKVNYSTAPIIFGTSGTNCQHSFFQLLHQGTHIVPVDFIMFQEPNNDFENHHKLLNSNCIAQSEALMRGSSFADSSLELVNQGMDAKQVNEMTPFRLFDGNRPSNTLVIKKLTPKNLGALIALYEHKVFVEGVIWNINSFDQFGVELGKRLATKVLKDLESNKAPTKHDSSTSGLIEKLKG